MENRRYGLLQVCHFVDRAFAPARGISAQTFGPRKGQLLASHSAEKQRQKRQGEPHSGQEWKPLRSVPYLSGSIPANKQTNTRKVAACGAFIASCSRLVVGPPVSRTKSRCNYVPIGGKRSTVCFGHGTCCRTFGYIEVLCVGKS